MLLCFSGEPLSSEDDTATISLEDIGNAKRIACATFLARVWTRRLARKAQRLGPTTAKNEKLTYQQVLVIACGEQSVKSVMKMLHRICNMSKTAVSACGTERAGSELVKRKLDDFASTSQDDVFCSEQRNYSTSARGISLEGHGDISNVVMNVNVKTNIHKFMAAFLMV